MNSRTYAYFCLFILVPSSLEQYGGAPPLLEVGMKNPTQVTFH